VQLQNLKTFLSECLGPTCSEKTLSAISSENSGKGIRFYLLFPRHINTISSAGFTKILRDVEIDEIVKVQFNIETRIDRDEVMYIG